MLQTISDRLRFLGGDEFFRLYDIDRIILRLTDTDLAFHITMFITI